MREAAPFLAEGAVEVASLPYVDPARFDLAERRIRRARRARRRHRAGERLAAREDRRARRLRHRGQGAAGRRGRVAAQDADGRRRRPGRRGRHPVGAGREFLLRFPRRAEGARRASRPIPRPARSARSASASTSRTTATSRPSRSPTTAPTSRRRSRRRDAELVVAEQETGRRQPGALPTLHDGPVGHRAVARHDAGRDQEPRPHLLLRRGLPDAAFGQRQPRGDLFRRERRRRGSRRRSSTRR